MLPPEWAISKAAQLAQMAAAGLLLFGSVQWRGWRRTAASREQRGAWRSRSLALRQHRSEPIRRKLKVAWLSPLFLPFLHGVARRRH